MKGRAYKNYLLAVLMLTLAFNYKDRMAFGLVLQDIKLDLGLSDTQLGLLSGIAFALFYSIMGIPIARWADRGNRVTIISISTALWSVAVACCALAGNFVQLLSIRIGVAVGEAGCVPPAHSLIADNFTIAQRPRANARFMLGTPLSFVLGYFVAGWLNELYGWRAMFVILGLPGLALAVLTRLTLKEPRLERPQPHTETDRSQAQPAFREVCTTLWANTTFRHLLIGISVAQFFGSGILQWKPTFFIRSYGLQTGEIGIWFAAISGLGGLLGLYWGGELGSRYAVNNHRLQLKTIACAYVFLGLISVGMFLSPNHILAFAAMGLATVGFNMTTAPFYATIQTLVPARMRAVSIALILLFSNLIGMGLGPLAAGVLSDAFRPWAGEQSLRYALMVLCPGYLWCAWHLWRASSTVTVDMSRRRLD